MSGSDCFKERAETALNEFLALVDIGEDQGVSEFIEKVEQQKMGTIEFCDEVTHSASVVNFDVEMRFDGDIEPVTYLQANHLERVEKGVVEMSYTFSDDEDGNGESRHLVRFNDHQVLVEFIINTQDEDKFDNDERIVEYSVSCIDLSDPLLPPEWVDSYIENEKTEALKSDLTFDVGYKLKRLISATKSVGLPAGKGMGVLMECVGTEVVSALYEWMSDYRLKQDDNLVSNLLYNLTSTKPEYDQAISLHYAYHDDVIRYQIESKGVSVEIIADLKADTRLVFSEDASIPDALSHYSLEGVVKETLNRVNLLGETSGEFHYESPAQIIKNSNHKQDNLSNK